MVFELNVSKFREGTSSKKAKEDDFSGATMAEIMEAMDYGSRKKRSRRKVYDMHLNQ